MGEKKRAEIRIRDLVKELDSAREEIDEERKRYESIMKEYSGTTTENERLHKAIMNTNKRIVEKQDEINRQEKTITELSGNLQLATRQIGNIAEKKVVAERNVKSLSGRLQNVCRVKESKVASTIVRGIAIVTGATIRFVDKYIKRKEIVKDDAKPKGKRDNSGKKQLATNSSVPRIHRQ